MARSKSRPERHPICLALQGGGSHGAFQWGVLDRLLEADILDNSKVDMSLTLPLTERVVVGKDEQGNTTIRHPGEPQRAADFLDPNWIPGAQGTGSEWVLPK